MSRPLLESNIVSAEETPEADRLREANRTLSRQLHDALQENEQLRKRVLVSDAPLIRLRERLQPFYALLQAVFGDIDEIALDAGNDGVTQTGKSSAVWESWKSRVGGAGSKIITALLEHGEANTQQLSILTGLHRTTIPKGIYDLNKAGLINKSGGRFSLKKLTP